MGPRPDVAALADAVTAFVRPYWHVLAAGLALVGAGFVFAAQALSVARTGFFLKLALYVLLQVTGWVLLIEWLRLSGHLDVAGSPEE